MTKEKPEVLSKTSQDRIELCNVKENEKIYQRFLLVNGRAGPREGRFDLPIEVHCPDYPTTTWPCVDSYFKALVHLTPGMNTIRFSFRVHAQSIPETFDLNVEYVPLVESPALTLFILIGSDSKGEFDVPPEKEGLNTLDIAVKKLRMAGYMWQAFCAEQMYRNNMGRRPFRLEEGWFKDTTSSQEKDVLRYTAKVQVIRSEHTVEEIRDIMRAQQCDDSDEDVPSLFDYCLEGLEGYVPDNKMSISAALILDSHWDPQQNVCLGHAALGGGLDNIRLGIFGSHLLHAWPESMEDIVPCMMNNTVTDTRYVANDNNESGHWWKALNIGMGAMLHEVGHAFSLTHTPEGIMSRGFNDWNKTFMAKEPGYGPIKPEDEGGSMWYRADIIRLRHHPSFALPSDQPILNKDREDPSFEVLENRSIHIKGPGGISLIEFLVDDHHRAHIEYLDNYPTDVGLNLEEIYLKCRSDRSSVITVEVTTIDLKSNTLSDIASHINDHILHLPGITGTVIKGNGYGMVEEDSTESRSLFFQNDHPRQLANIIVYHGQFLDGMIFQWADGTEDRVGETGGSRSCFKARSGESIQALVIRSGCYVDGIQFKMSSGRASPWYGGDGGGIHEVEPPKGCELIGLYASADDWVIQAGIYYRKKGKWSD
ncbi:putative peptidase family-domain-containing protein [Pilobolus umbonatus]|nr:putative peptidase family-domain-containing protein [Pilobolus umbonatus]